MGEEYDEDIRNTVSDEYVDDVGSTDPEAVFQESNENDELPKQRSVFDDIKAFELVMKTPLTYQEQGLLAIKYRVSTCYFTWTMTNCHSLV